MTHHVNIWKPKGTRGWLDKAHICPYKGEWCGGKYPNKDFHKNTLSHSDNGYARWSVTLTILAMVVDERPSMWPWLYTVPARQFYLTPRGRLGIRHFAEENLTGSVGCCHNFLSAQILWTWSHNMTTVRLLFSPHGSDLCSKWQAATSCRKRPRKPVGGAYCHRMKFPNKSFDNKLLGALSPIILQEKGIHSPCKTRTHCTA